MTPFDHLKNLHTKKKNWNDFNDEEKKNFKSKFKKSGLLKELRENQYYEKKSRKKRLLKNKAIHKQKYLNKSDDE